MKKIVIAYVPALHDGYYQFFSKHAPGADLFILGSEIIEKFPHLKKEIRQLDPKLVKEAIESWKVFNSVSILDEAGLKKIGEEKPVVVMPKEDILQELYEKYFPGINVVWDSIFLRWDKHNTVAENTLSPDVHISSLDFDKKMIALTYEEAEKSSDWWRRIGSVVLKEGKVILTTHNRHLPTDHTPYINGDPRNNFSKGIHLELGTSIHSEASVIAEAARQGISLEGSEIYVTTFPCPPCAKLIACSGVKKLFYRVGYGILDAESILKQNGVEIIQVEE